MSKKLSRSMILSFFIVVAVVSYHLDMMFMSLFWMFWLGFVVSAIVSKEQGSLMFWAASKGIPTDSLMKKEEDKRDGTKKESDGEAEQET